MNEATARDLNTNQRSLVYLICVGLVAIVWIVFGQTIGFHFVNLDDQVAVFENPHVAGGLNRANLVWLFTHFDVNFYAPLTTISHIVDWHFYRANPAGHHFTNVLLHATSTVLLFLVFKEMTGGLWRSAFVAAVFAIHPLHVESVAWVTERKDTLSGLFFMLTLAAYLRYVRKPKSLARYAAVLLLFALGLLTKPTLVTLPFVLLLLDYWPLKRFEKSQETVEGAAQNIRPVFHVVAEKVPLLVLSSAACAIAYFAEGNAIMSVEKYSLLFRTKNALISYLIYIQQTIWPARLAAFYPNSVDLPFWRAAVAFIVLAAVSLIAFVWRRRYPALFVGWFWFVGMLFPMIGFVQIGEFAHADRCTYLAQIGLVMSAAWSVPAANDRRAIFRLAPTYIGALCLVALTLAARKQATYWHDSEALWTRAIACTSNNAIAHNDLGLVLRAHGRTEEAVSHYHSALLINPGFAEAHNNLGIILRREGHIDEAITHFREALANRPHYSEAHSNLGNALLQSGQESEAILQYRAALEDDPNLTGPRNNLAVALMQQGKAREAAAQYRAAMTINPRDPSFPINLAWLLATNSDGSVRDGAEAISLAKRALALTPVENATTLDSLAAAYAEVGRFDEAVATARRARDLAGTEGNTSLARSIEKRIDLYLQHNAYRDVIGASTQP